MKQLLIICLAVILGACASAPLIQDEAGPEEFASLAPEGLMYFYADAGEGRAILDKMSLGTMDLSYMGQALDMTSWAAAAVYPEESGRRFMADARGKFPAFRSSLSFTFSSAWKKVRSETGTKYWHSSKQGLSLYIKSGRALVSDGDPFAEGPGPAVPASYGSIRKGAVIAGWLENASVYFNRFLNEWGIPMQFPADRFVFALHPLERNTGETAAADGGEGQQFYQGLFIIEAPSVSQAKAFQALFSMLSFFAFSGGISPEDSEFFDVFLSILANPPVQQENLVSLRSAAIEADKVALLLNRFSVYFDQSK